ncbi:glycoside hydrolase family 92 protein [Eubacteriales bacterium OttesenSCG-928-N14]|nr:glycoside hydrolase family 92 protein [Eubacteriales bacterium OttesenSCG-928-N14]
MLCCGKYHIFKRGQYRKMEKSYADLVNPHIGGIGHLLQATQPVVMWPHSSAVLFPVYTPGVVDTYLAETVHGFPINASSFMVDARQSEADPIRTFSGIDHDCEDMKCYKGEILLEDSNICVEYTAGEHSAYYRITFPANRWNSFRFNGNIAAGGRSGVQAGAMCGLQLDVRDNCIISGYTMHRPKVNCYFYIELSQKATKVKQDDSGALLSFAPSEKEFVLQVKAGLSYISVEQAGANMQTELGPLSFEQAVAATKQAWNQALGLIEVEGGTEDERIAFYTALYRVYGRMQNITEYGRYFGLDKKVHEDNQDFYINDGIWDTYRTAHPLQLILQESRQMDIINSYLRIYQTTGWLPSFPHLLGNLNTMLGKHATAMIVDTWQKGYRGFDIELAYEAMLKNADLSTKMTRSDGTITDFDLCYFEKGFYPALAPGEKEKYVSHPRARRQSVAATLENCYDDWCLAQIAKELGRDEDYQRLLQRGESYRNVYNPQTGFMSPRLEDGSWLEDFNPKLSGGQGGWDYYCECNAWVYTWHVQHRVDGLIELMGGKDIFCRRLDELFCEQYEVPKYTFLGQFPDSTGLVGQFCLGNEPSFHIPYLYNYGGQPWKTQRRVRELMRLWFPNSPFGYCGDEDGGALGGWFVFSAMGFYPTCPGKPVYDIGSPIFDRVKIHMENGKTFTIIANNQHAKHKYIQSARLNGKEYNSPQLQHADLVCGGTLELDMDKRPNKSWGV